MKQDVMVDWPVSPEWLFPILAAPFVGSFLGTLVIRLPAGEGVVAGRSACRSCRHNLGAPDLVPLLSWLWTRGRCRHCARPIGWLYPAIELAALGVVLWAAAATSGWIFWASCALGWTLLALAVIDGRTLVLPDVLTLPLVLAGLAVAWRLDPAVVWHHALAAGLGFAVLAVAGETYRRLRGQEGLGMGDAKLLAASGAWVSWVGLPSVIFLGGAVALLVTLIRACRGSGPALQQRIAFGPYLALATWFVWLHGPLVIG